MDSADFAANRHLAANVCIPVLDDFVNRRPHATGTKSRSRSGMAIDVEGAELGFI
jgi:hypothetical protein